MIGRPSGKARKPSSAVHERQLKVGLACLGIWGRKDRFLAYLPK